MYMQTEGYYLQWGNTHTHSTPSCVCVHTVGGDIWAGCLSVCLLRSATEPARASGKCSNVTAPAGASWSAARQNRYVKAIRMWLKTLWGGVGQGGRPTANRMCHLSRLLISNWTGAIQLLLKFHLRDTDTVRKVDVNVDKTTAQHMYILPQGV